MRSTKGTPRPCSDLHPQDSVISPCPIDGTTEINRFAWRDWNVNSLKPDALPVGEQYMLTQFRDTEANTHHHAAFTGCGDWGGTPFFPSIGMWGLFPWHRVLKVTKGRDLMERQMNWRKRFPYRDVPPDCYFGTDPFDDPMRKGFATYLETASYWSRVALYEGRWSPEDCRKLARHDTVYHLKLIFSMKPKELRKFGYEDVE